MLGTSLDPSTEALFTHIISILLPIIYTIAGFSLIFIAIKFGFKLHFDSENKAQHIKSFIWSVIGVLVIFMSTGISHIIILHILSSSIN